MLRDVLFNNKGDKKMKLTKIALASALALGTTVAQADIEGNIGATSNYMWRGLTQTQDGAAISGGLDYSNESGIYAGVWVSNVDFGSDDMDGEIVGYETDLYGGISGEMNGVGYDAGVIFYTYPTSQDGNFTEIAVSASMGMVTVGLASVVAADNDTLEGDLYYYISAGVDVMDGMTLSGTIGSTDPDAAGDGYTHVNLSLGKGMGDLGDFSLNLDTIDDALNPNGDNATVSVAWSKGF
jgi:uncharacterized protein (TIGR02001 family)